MPSACRGEFRQRTDRRNDEEQEHDLFHVRFQQPQSSDHTTQSRRQKFQGMAM
jgi:hypothetical protein